LGPAADIYSLGAILFDMLAGRPPFVGEHALAVISQASEKSAPRLRTLAPSIDRDLETICARCLDREPTARYHSAADLAEDLERWIEGRPIIARPVSPPVRIWRWSKRNPKLAGSQILGAVVGGIGMALHEETAADHRFGRFMVHNLADYHVPVNADVHGIEVIFVEEKDDEINPLGVKGVGEIGIVGTAAAIANAIYHATGKHIHELPVKVEKLL